MRSKNLPVKQPGYSIKCIGLANTKLYICVMSRQYPKYLYQKVTNARSNGEFICSTITPRIIVKVVHSGLNIQLVLLEKFEPVRDEELAVTMQLMKKWYIHNIHTNAKEEMGLSIYEAYSSLLETSALNKILDLSKSTVSNIKKNIIENQIFPKYENMKGHLVKAGWSMVSEEKWELRIRK
jgi:hypothetical protein